MQFRTLYENELDKWYCFLCEEIFTSAPLSYFKREWECDPFRDIDSIFVAIDADGRITSGARVFTREIYLNGEIIKAGGIGSVGTRADCRKKGLSTKLFDMCIDYMRKKGMDISYLLCGAQNEKYYNRYDYKTCRLKKMIAKVESDVPYREAYTIRDVDFSKDTETLAKMYQTFSSRCNGSSVRNADYWKRWVTSFGYCNYLIAENDEGTPQPI